MAETIVGGVGAACRELDVEPLDPKEEAGGIHAFSLLLYKYEAGMSPELLCFGWLLMVAGPRAVAKYQESKKLKAPANEEPAPPPAPTASAA